MLLQLSRGMTAEIDDADFDKVKDMKWSVLAAGGHFYAITTVARKTLLMHRLLLGLDEKGVLVDHIDGNGLNNRRANLRACSHAENMRNTKVRSHSSTGIRNVRFDKRRNLFHAVVTMNGAKHRKWFSDVEKAAEWARLKREELHGQFAYQRGDA